MKMAEITPLCKEDDRTKKDYYRPVSILPSVLKIFEKNMYDNINKIMNDKLSPYLCGFRKGYNTQYYLMIMLEKWKKAIDNKKVAGALLTDLSKAFDCLHHDLLIAKLEAYRIGHSSLILIYNYLSGRKQRTKVNNVYTEWNELETGIPQGSILGPLIFNIYINDIFYFVNEDTVADDNIPYTIQNNIETLLNNLQSDSHTLLMWFDNNNNCKLLVTNMKMRHLDEEVIKGNKTVNLMGIKIDNKLDFNEHISNIYKKASLLKTTCLSKDNTLYE